MQLSEIRNSVNRYIASQDIFLSSESLPVHLSAGEEISFSTTVQPDSDGKIPIAVGGFTSGTRGLLCRGVRFNIQDNQLNAYWCAQKDIEVSTGCVVTMVYAAREPFNNF